MPTLLDSVRGKDHLLQQRALLTLYHVTKTLASKRLGADRKLFQELTSSILGFISHLWNYYTKQFLELLALGDLSALQALEKSTLSLKVLRKLIVYGVKDFHTSDEVVECITAVFERLNTFLQCRKKVEGNDHGVEMCEKHVSLLMKLLLDLQEQHPLSYGQFITTSLECVVMYLFTEAGSNMLYERFTVQCLNMMKAIITCSDYRPAKVLSETKNPLTLKAHKAKMDFFTAETLIEICRRLLSRYFLLTNLDLDIWKNDPEDFAIDESGEAWKFSLRPCTEILFLSLFREFKTTLTPVLLGLVSEMQSTMTDPSDLNIILQKDAVYTAVGLASFELFDEVDFDHWFTTYLKRELCITGPLYKIIRRRVVWLIGQWVGVKMSVSLRPALYECLQPLLTSEEDLVVRITAATTLKLAIDDFEFNVEQFMPFLKSSFALLFQLLKDVSECDTKMHVLHVLSFMIERCGNHIRPYAEVLMQYLPLLWESSGEHNMLRCAILSTLVHLVQGLGASSEQLHGFLLPVIQLSTDTSQEPHIYLLEDGLDLWLVTLHNATSISPGLLQLFSNMNTLLELGSDNLKTCFCLIQAYILLGPQQFLEKYANAVVQACLDTYSDMRPEGLVMILRLVELVIRVFPTEGPQMFRDLLPRVLSGVVDYEDYPVVLAMNLAVLSRVILQNCDIFSKVVQEVAHNLSKPVEEVFKKLLDIWTDRINCVTQPERRKLCGLAIARLLDFNSQVVVEKFPDLMIMIVEILHDICREDNGVQCDSLIISSVDDLEDDDLDTEHDRRKRLLSVKDPVHTVSLKDCVMSQLQSCQRLHGEQTFNQMMTSVDSEITAQLQDFFK